MKESRPSNLQVRRLDLKPSRKWDLSYSYGQGWLWQFSRLYMHNQVLQPPSFADMVQRLTNGNMDTKWVTETHVIRDNRETVTHTIWLGRAMAVMDGSFKDKFDTTAYMIEGEDSQHTLPPDFQTIRAHYGANLQAAMEWFWLSRPYVRSIV